MEGWKTSENDGLEVLKLVVARQVETVEPPPKSETMLKTGQWEAAGDEAEGLARGAGDVGEVILKSKAGDVERNE